MNTIYIMIGISGSGKSTYARAAMTGNEVIVSRDGLRNSLFGYTDENVHEYYQRADFKTCEGKVTKFFNDQVRYALNNGMDVIADNTHLNKSYINAYKQFGVELKLIWRPVFTLTAIYRDQRRARCVGEDVIRKQAFHFAKLRDSDIQEEIDEFNAGLKEIYRTCKKADLDYSKPMCVIFDIDGTLAHTKGLRSPYDYSKVHLDDVDGAVSWLAHILDKRSQHDVIICSGREESCKEETEKWLEFHGIYHKGLYMRKAGDNRKDNIIKAELWREIQEKYNIVAMFDDRNRVVDMGRMLGYKMIQVENGDF